MAVVKSSKIVTRYRHGNVQCCNSVLIGAIQTDDGIGLSVENLVDVHRCMPGEWRAMVWQEQQIDLLLFAEPLQMVDGLRRSR